MPSSAASVRPSAFTSSTNSFRSPACSSIGSEIVSQPSRLPISGPGPPHSVSSLRQTRAATSSATARSTRLASGGSSSSGIEESIVGGRPVTAASLLDSTPAISLSNGVTNAAMPSSQQLVGHVVHVDAGLGERVERRRSGPGRRSRRSISDFSAAASSVGIGIVFTVSGATRPSTYFVSG